jgi:hypothetical protein
LRRLGDEPPRAGQEAEAHVKRLLESRCGHPRGWSDARHAHVVTARFSIRATMPKSGPMNEEWAETMRLRSIGDAILEIIRLTEETTRYGSISAFQSQAWTRRLT